MNTVKGSRKLIVAIICLSFFLAVMMTLIFMADKVDQSFVNSLAGLVIPLATGIGSIYLIFVGGNSAVHIFGNEKESKNENNS